MRLPLVMLSLSLSAAMLTAQAKIDGAPPVYPGEDVVTAPGPHVPSSSSAPTIVPAADATRLTNRANSIPWSWTPTHFQSPYLGSEMPASLLIRCIGFRHGNRTDTGASINLEVWLGYTTFDNTNITTNYANNANQGALTKVYDRKNYNVVDMEQANTDPAFFKNQIPLDRPFIWQRRAGRNLLFECKVYSNSNSNRSFSYFPEQCSTGGTTTRLYSNNNANATTGFVTRSLAPVLSFDVNCKTTANYEIYGAGCKGTGGFSGQVLPADYATVFGNTSNSFPHGRANIRYQQVHAGTELGNRPLILEGLSLRQDDLSTGRPGGAQQMEIRIGQTDRTPIGLGPDFDGNYDSNGSTVVFKGTVNLPTQSGRNTDPTKFFSLAPFTRAYTWIPRAGKNVLLEIINTSSTTVSQFHDAASFFPNASRIYALDATAKLATTGTRNYALVLGLAVRGGVGSAVPTLENSGRPKIGNSTFAVCIDGARGSAPFLVGLGISDKMFGAIPLPFDLAPLGAAGCKLLASLDLVFAGAANGIGQGSVTLPIPNQSALVGVTFFNQALVVDPAANGLGIAFTAGGKATIGEQ